MGEPELINALHPCMVRLLPVVEGPRVRTVKGPRKVELFCQKHSCLFLLTVLCMLVFA